MSDDSKGIPSIDAVPYGIPLADATGKIDPDYYVAGGGTPAVSVTDETTYGIAPAVGASTNYARQDHTHGSPTAPTAASVGADATGTAAAAIVTHVGLADPHTQYQRESEKSAASGYASLDGATKVPIAELPTGATASTVCIGNDSRLSDSRTPTAHATSHKLGGSDVILLNEFGLPTGSVAFNDQQATSFRIENRTSDPGTPTVGQIWLRTDL